MIERDLRTELSDVDGAPRMMRDMAKQIRTLIKDKLTPITPRMHHLADQLEQSAAALETDIAKTTRPN